MTLNTEHFQKCIATLELSLKQLHSSKPDALDYEVFRNATIKGFELTLEIAGKLLRKVLKTYAGNPRVVDELTYKEVFRQALQHGLINEAAVKRWFAYRENRNNTAHDYGVAFEEETLKLLPSFLKDAHELQAMIQKKFGTLHEKN